MGTRCCALYTEAMSPLAKTFAPDARLLSMDTSTQRLVIALSDGASLHGIDEEGGARASSRLLPAVMELMQRASWPMASLDAIAFARGPGAFTGLRTAASAAQGLAFGLGRPVLALDSLMIVAEDAWLQRPALLAEGVCVAVAMDARMDQIYAARYTRLGDGWQVDEEPALFDPEQLGKAWHGAPPQWVAGSALSAYASRLEVPAGSGALPTMAFAPQALAAVARQAWRAGLAVEPQDAQPLYVRDKVAFTTLEREAQRAEVAVAAAGVHGLGAATPSPPAL